MSVGVVAANTISFAALLSLSYVLPEALKETMSARLVTRFFCSAFLVVGALTRLSLATSNPVSWWANVAGYAQAVLVTGFLVFLTLDTFRAVRRFKAALEEVYEELGAETGDRVAAIFRVMTR